jgi:effector-binding domain-containing protein
MSSNKRYARYAICDTHPSSAIRYLLFVICYQPAKEHMMDYKCEIVEQPAWTTLSVRTHSPVQELPKLLPDTYRRIGEYLAELGEKPAGVPFAAYYNMDMTNLDVEAGVATTRKLSGKGDIQPSSLPAGKAAMCLYVGPYPDLPKGYDALKKWMDAQGLEALGPCYEIYVGNPDETPPDKLETQILFPIK